VADVRTKADTLFVRQSVPLRLPYGLRIPVRCFRPACGQRNQSYGLEEVESEWFSHQLCEWRARSSRRELPGDARVIPVFAGFHRNTMSPARGGHSRRSPSRRVVVTTVWVNEFNEAYTPRNRSRIAPNK